VVPLRVLCDEETVLLREVPEGKSAVLHLNFEVPKVVLHVEVDEPVVTEVNAVPPATVEAAHVASAAVTEIVTMVVAFTEAKAPQGVVKTGGVVRSRHLSK
jgi:hypothetical protein